MKKLFMLGMALAMAATASAAPNVTNATQKGSLLIFPDIRIDGPWNTLVRISNDGSSDVDVLCYWMDGNKNRVDFIIPITRNQAVWFDARTGAGTFQVNRFPQTAANGINNPFLPAPDVGPFFRGLLACWAVDNGAQNQVKWNHLSGTATVYLPGNFAYEYNAYSFFVPTGIDLAPVGTAGTLNLNGVEYDSCPLYSIGQFTPPGAPVIPGTLPVAATRIALAACSLNLNQDFVPVWTKYEFEIWNADEVKFTGAFDCADSWHEVIVPGEAGYTVDAAEQNFLFSTLGTYSARYRVQGVASTQCTPALRAAGFTGSAQAVGVIGVQSSLVTTANADFIGTTLAGAGKFTGRIVWDPEGAVPEGGIR